MSVTATANPTSDESVAGTWTGSAGTRYTVVDDYPDTSGTDELTHGTTAGNLTFGYTAFSIPSTATAITVFVDYYDYKNGSQSCNFAGRLKVGGSYFNAATHNPANGSGSRTQRTDTWANNPKTSAAWTPAEVNGTDATNPLQAFGYFSSDASPTITTSSVRVRVTYTSDYPITAASGSYTVTGQVATLTAQRKLTAGAGSFALTGQDATLRVAMPADAGSYVLTGYDATLTYTPAEGPSITAEPGSFSLTGQPATLTAQRIVTADTGSFAVSGQVAVLAVTLPADAGSFAVSGQDAAFAHGYAFVADAGAFSVTGQAATLSTTRWLTATVGAFVLSGQAAAFVYNPHGGGGYTGFISIDIGGADILFGSTQTFRITL